MKNFNKLMIILLMSGASGKMAAYTYEIKNNSGSKVKLRIFVDTGQQMVGPSAWREIPNTRRYTFTSNACLDRIEAMWWLGTASGWQKGVQRVYWEQPWRNKPPVYPICKKTKFLLNKGSSGGPLYVKEVDVLD